MTAPTARIDTAAAATAALPRRPRIAAAVLAATVLVHALLWHWLQGVPTMRAAAPSAVRVSILRVERPEAAPRRRPPEPVRTPAAAARGGPAATPRPVATPPAPESPPATDPPSPAAAANAASAAAPPPSAPNGVGLLDTAATRRAIREAARSPSMADLGDAPISVDRKLGAAIAAGAHGDCDKGEFAGGGMGLLSLPFWALAKLREQCSR